MFNIFLRCLSNDSNGGRSREQTEHIVAEADNEVVSIGRIGKVNLFAFDYTRKIYNCAAIRLRSYSADKSAEAQQAERSPYPLQNKERDCVPCFVVDRGLATALAYARYA